VINRYELERHYGGNGLIARLDDALAKAGLAGKRLSPIDLAPLDQFHACGLAATIELAEMAAVRSGERVIDIGSGLGGPSRYLATKYGCRVVGVDLSPTFVAASTFLAERSGLADKVNYRCADALALPFLDRHFELAWTQHVANECPIIERKQTSAVTFGPAKTDHFISCSNFRASPNKA